MHASHRTVPTQLTQVVDRVLESTRTRDEGDAMDEARAMAMTGMDGCERYGIMQSEQREIRTHTVGTSEREVGRGCLTNTVTKREGEGGPICLVSTRPDAARFICKECGYDEYAKSRECKFRNAERNERVW